MANGKRRTDGERIEDLAERKRAIDACMQAIGTRTERRRRKEDTGRKIRVGALVPERTGNGGKGERAVLDWLHRELHGFVGERDRHLFDGLGVKWAIPERDADRTEDASSLRQA